MNFLPQNNDIMTLKQARELNPLVLAYVGDGVHTLYIRLKALNETTGKADKLHKYVTARVNAGAQAECMRKIEGMLNEDEQDIFRRARNSHQHSMAKNASVADYKAASGFEAVIGYLYLTGQNQRLGEILELCETDNVDRQ